MPKNAITLNNGVEMPAIGLGVFQTPPDVTTAEARLDQGREVVSATFVIRYPSGFPILVPGQVISRNILTFMRALDTREVHGYLSGLGYGVFTEEALR